MERSDFNNWLPFKTDWHEVLRQYNISGDYKHKQDLVAVFFTAYKDIELKFIPYFNEFSVIPNDVFNDLIYKFRQSFPKHGRIEGISYFDDLIELLIDKYTPNTVEAENPAADLFIPEIDNLNEWVLSDHISKFTKVEVELFNRGYIDKSYKWQKQKTTLCDFLCVIIDYRYFKSRLKGKPIEDFHKRQFISERYGYGKTGLSETWKKVKPQLKGAIIPFLWIEKPE